MYSFSKMYALIVVAFLLLPTSVFPAVTPEDESPEGQTIFQNLFTEDELLEVTLTLPLDSLINNPFSENYFPAEWRYEDDKGNEIIRQINVKQRGKSRRLNCEFPPLKIKFSKDELINDGIRKHHKKLKLVTHCSDEVGATQNVVEEYLAYRMYNQLTDNSFKVQLVKIKYKDVNSNKSFKRFGFLIEDVDELAERLGGEEVEGFGKKPEEFVADNMAVFSTFQFMIGNEDWRIPFMRNVKFIATPEADLLAIPYDFDASGLVNATYARPDADYQMQTNLQRRFQGQFRNRKQRAQTIALFNDKKAAIVELIQSNKWLKKSAKDSVMEYITDFYTIINDTDMLKKAMPLNEEKVINSDLTGTFNFDSK